MRFVESGRLVKLSLVALIAVLLPGLSGCAAGSRVGHQQVNDSRRASSIPGRSQVSTGAVAESLKVDKPLSTAIEEFLSRTQEYAGQDQAAPKAAAVALPVAKLGTNDTHAGRESWREKPVFRSTVLTPAKRNSGQAVLARDTNLSRDTMSSSVVGRRPAAIPAIQRVFVRSASRPKALPKIHVVNEVSNQPMNAGAQAAITSDRVMSFYREQMHDGTSLEDVWTLKFVELALGRPTDDKSSMSSLGLNAQQTLGALLKAAEQVHMSLMHPTAPADDAVKALDALRAKMIGQVDPELSNTFFCRSVTNYGIYEEMPRDSFVTGQRVQTIVYSEIDNLSSEVGADGMHRTVLGTHLEVLTVNGETVWQDEQPEIVDRCKRKRRDFFVAQRVTLPATLPAGDYILKVFVEDKLSGRATEVAHKFEMFSPSHLAKPQGLPG